MLFKDEKTNKLIKALSSGLPEASDPGVGVLDNKGLNELAHKVNGVQAEASIMQKALSGIGGVAELQGIEGDFEILNIYRDSIALDMCEIRNLPLGEIPLFRWRSLRSVGITVGSLAGMGTNHYWSTKDAGQRVAPFTIDVEKVMVPNLNNVYDMERLMQRREAIARQDYFLKQGVNNAVINTIFANSKSVSFKDDPYQSILNYAADGGSFAGKNVYVLDPGVRQTSVPSVNYYDLSATENGLTKKVFQTIRTHSWQIGRNFNRMYVPTGATSGKSPVWEALQNMATPVALVTGQGNQNPAAAVPHEMWSQFQQDDFSGSVSVSWFGESVTVSKQNWLPEGYLVLFCDQPAAIMWDRLDLGADGYNEGTIETPVNGFYSERFRAKNIATARPDYCLRNILLVKVSA